MLSTPGANAKNPQLMECITSWLREVPVAAIVASPLLEVVFQALDYDVSVQAAAECICAICRETRAVDDYGDTIRILLPCLVALRPKIQEFATEGDTEGYKALTRIFA